VIEALQQELERLAQGFAAVLPHIGLGLVVLAIRTTNIRTYDGLHVLVPNAQVYNNVITHKTYYPARRFTLSLGIAYDSELPKAQRAILDAVSCTPGVLAVTESILQAARREGIEIPFPIRTVHLQPPAETQ